MSKPDPGVSLKGEGRCTRPGCGHPESAHRMRWPDMPCYATVTGRTNALYSESWPCPCVNYFAPKEAP